MNQIIRKLSNMENKKYLSYFDLILWWLQFTKKLQEQIQTPPPSFFLNCNQ